MALVRPSACILAALLALPGCLTASQQDASVVEGEPASQDEDREAQQAPAPPAPAPAADAGWNGTVLLAGCTMQLAGLVDSPPTPSPIGYPPDWNRYPSHDYGLTLLACDRLGWATLERPVMLALELVASGRPPEECSPASFTPYRLSQLWVSDQELAQAWQAAGVRVAWLPMNLTDGGARLDWSWGGSMLTQTSLHNIAYPGGWHGELAFWWNETAVSHLVLRVEIPTSRFLEVPAQFGTLGPETLYPRAAVVPTGTFVGTQVTGQLVLRPGGGYDCRV